MPIEPIPQRAVRQLLYVMLAVDVLVIGLHLGSGGMSVFNLDGEANLPTWYSSFKLLCVGAAAVLAWRAEGARLPGVRHRNLWLLIAGLFVALSADETASFHERLARTLVQAGPARSLRALVLGGDASKDSFAWVLLFAPIAVVVFFFLAGFAWSRREHLGRAWQLGAAGLAGYLMAMVLEPMAVYFTPAMSDWSQDQLSRYQLLSTIEESGEIFGTTLLLAATLFYRPSEDVVRPA